MINILANIICYRARLEKNNCLGLVKESFNDDTIMHTKGLSDWYTCLDEVLRYLNVNKQQLQTLSVKTIQQNCIRKLRLLYDHFFRNALFNDNRLSHNQVSQHVAFLTKNKVSAFNFTSLSFESI